MWSDEFLVSTDPVATCATEDVDQGLRSYVLI